MLEESLTLARGVGEPWPIAYALMHGIFRIANSAAIERSKECLGAWAASAEALRLVQAVGDGLNSTVMQAHLGQIALYEGDHKRARAAFVACLPMLSALGWRSAVAETLIRLASVAHAQGNDGEAASLYTEALALYRRLGDQWLPAVAWVHAQLADLALERGDWMVAETQVVETLILARDNGLDGVPEFAEAPLPRALEVRAALAAVQETPRRSIRLAGAAAALRTQINRALAASARATLERRLAPARQALSTEEQAQAWTEGQAMTPEQAVADALE
ncbi:MAG: tetratricopeptide repeat protein [Chloroflexota bacterium]